MMRTSPLQDSLQAGTAEQVCTGAFIRLRMGCQNQPWDTGNKLGFSGNRGFAHSVTWASQATNTDLVFQCQALQHICERNPRLFGHTMVRLMWQADLLGVAQFVTDCLDAYHIPEPKRGQASDHWQP